MEVRFWGARGSHPRPMTPDELRSKISTVIHRVQTSDLEDAQSRERFLLGLPDWLFRPPGGNTPCVELRLGDQESIVFDAGTGIIQLAEDWARRGYSEDCINLFFTHFHYDHVQGLPFFGPAYNPASRIRFFSPVENFETTLRSQMQHPFFPVTMEGKMTESMEFHVLKEDELFVSGARVRYRLMNHPGGAYAYRVDYHGRSFIYASDAELQNEDFEHSQANRDFFEGVDVLILDTQYTLGEAIEKYNWGHSAFSLSVDFALTWKVKRLFMFHHEPRYSDKRLVKNLESARAYAVKSSSHDLKIELSREGSRITV